LRPRPCSQAFQFFWMASPRKKIRPTTPPAAKAQPGTPSLRARSINGLLSLPPWAAVALAAGGLGFASMGPAEAPRAIAKAAATSQALLVSLLLAEGRKACGSLVWIHSEQLLKPLQRKRPHSLLSR
jgi:hypothetical protein